MRDSGLRNMTSGRNDARGGKKTRPHVCGWTERGRLRYHFGNDVRRPLPRTKQIGRYDMDLGLSGRKAIVCASSRGLGRGCAEALAQAGCDLVINGLDRLRLETAASEIRSRYGVDVASVVADVSTREGQDALLAACPEPDILVNNNGGPPRRDYRN